MDEALNNVQMMKSHGQAQLAGVNTSLSLLDEVRDLAVTRMSAALSSVIERVAKELFDLADKNPSHAMYCLYMDTRDQVLTQNVSLVSAFKRQLFEHFNEVRKREDIRETATPTLDASEFNLVEPDELELTLAGNTISHALRLACGEELPGLERRMGLLMEDPDLQFGANPLGMEVVGDALMDAIRTLPAGNKVKLMLVSRLNLHLPTLFKEVFQEINRLLVDKGIILSNRMEVRRAQVAPLGKPMARSAERQAPRADMFAMLQKLMAMGRIGAAPTLPPLPGSAMAEAANEGEIDSAQVMHRLTQIQHGDLSNLPGGTLDPVVLMDGQVNVLRAIKHTGVAGSMGQIDAMTLDIVALMFDYILGDPRLPDSMKALIGRLQIPVLKVAMLDKGFFSHKAHPARKLLDALATAALGWNEQEGHESLFYRTIEGLVQQVLDEFEDKTEVFTLVLTRLQEFMAEEKRQADERAARSAQVLQRTEQIELARTLALEAIQARLLDSEAPEFVVQFLQGPWINHLATLYVQDGASGKGWSQALETVDDLLWSLTPKVSKEERQKLVALLPILLKRLDDGIQALGQSKEERDHFFTELVKFHSEAVKTGLQSKRVTDYSRDSRPPLVPSSVPYLFDSPEFRDIPAPAENMETDHRILREITSIPVALADSEEIVIGDVVGQTQLATEEGGPAATYEHQVRQLKRGTWMEFTLDDESTLRAKLAWISPLRGTYLFTNRLGERALSINAAGLARKLREGSASIVDNVALIDRAVNSLFERLQKSS